MKLRLASSVLLPLVVVAAAAAGTLPRGAEAGGGCAAVADKECDPCYPAGTQKYCEDWKKQCKKNLCYTLCLRETWTMKFEATGDGELGAAIAKEVAHESVQLALWAQFGGHACSSGLGCCEADTTLQDWAEQRTYEGQFPDAALPIPACRIPDREAACKACKMKATPKTTVEKCDKYLEHPDAAGTLTPVFGRSMVPNTPESPKQKNFRVNCEDVAEAAMNGFGAAAAKVAEDACMCMGCCDPPKGKDACPFPIDFPSVDATIERIEGGPKKQERPPAAEPAAA